jgi:dCMP deaminase
MEEKTESFIDKVDKLISIYNSRPSWNEFFMSIAILTSARSSCDRLHVGCILVKDNRVISAGYNGFIAGSVHQSIIRDNHEQGTIHAEINAICNAALVGMNISNSTAYITHHPCINCFKALMAAKIKKIYYHNDHKNDPLIDILISNMNEKDRELPIIIKI